MVAVTGKVWDPVAVAGGFVSAVTTRSGLGCTTVCTDTVPSAVVQLLLSEPSGMTPAASMHAFAL